MNNGLNARANSLLPCLHNVRWRLQKRGTKEKKKLEERKKTVVMHEREREGAFLRDNSRKVETKREHREKKKKEKKKERESGTSFHLLLLLVSEAHTVSGMVMNIEQQATTAPTSATHNPMVRQNARQLSFDFDAVNGLVFTALSNLSKYCLVRLTNSRMLIRGK